MVLGGGAGRHTLRRGKDQSCMGQVGRHLGLLLGGYHQEAVGKERMVACRYQEDQEVGMGLHYMPGEDMAPWSAVVDMGALGRWMKSTWRSLSSCASRREQGKVYSNTRNIAEKVLEQVAEVLGRG